MEKYTLGWTYRSVYVTLDCQNREPLKDIKLKQKVSTADTASIIKSHIPLPKLGLNHSCCIALCVDLYFLCMSEKWVFIYSCYQFLSWYLWVSHGNRFLCDWASIIFLLWVLAEVWMQSLKQRDGKIYFSRNSFFASELLCLFWFKKTQTLNWCMVSYPFSACKYC